MRKRSTGIRLSACLLGVLAVVSAVRPETASAQCVLSGGPVQFEPTPQGVSRPGYPFSAGYSNALDLYKNGTSDRMMMAENFGYSILDITNPVNPIALAYYDMTPEVGRAGDGQSFVVNLTVAPDGSRALVGTSAPSTLSNVVMSPTGLETFRVAGDFFFASSTGGVVVHNVGSRYLAYALRSNVMSAAEITTMLPGNHNPNSIGAEVTPFPGGSNLQLASPYLVYQSGPSAVVVNAGSPGPAVHSLTTSMPWVSIANSAWGRPASESLRSLAAGVDPQDASASPKLYLLGEFVGTSNVGAGFTLMSLTGGTGGTLSAIGTFRPPAPYSGPGSSPSGLVTVVRSGIGSDLMLFMWAYTAGSYKLYSTSVNSWGGPPTEIQIDQVSYPTFGLRGMKTLVSGTSAWAYIPTSSAAFVLPMTCLSASSPASGDLRVEPDPCPGASPCPLADGATVFLGDKLKITPSIYSSKPLTDWRFDYDFHSGTGEDNGTAPRIRYPDLQSSGAGSVPPATISLFGPCDPKIGAADPSTGAGCWSAVQNNGAYGGPDYATAFPVSGTTKTLTIALEASNVNGTNPPRQFPLLWKVPAVRLQSTSLLLGNPTTVVTDASEGSPLASGYRWYFGTNPAAPAGETLVRDAGCSGRTCNHAFTQRGTYSYWLRVPYANGYASADCGSPCTQRLGTIVVADVALAFSPSSSIQAGQSVLVTNNSQLAPAVTPCPLTHPGYQFNFCDAAAGSCPAGAWTEVAMASTGGSTSLPSPALPGTYWLRLRYVYTTSGNCGSSLTSNWTPTVSGVSDATAWPVSVTAVVPTIQILVNGVDPCIGGFCTPGSFDVLTGDVLTANALVNGVLDPSPPATLSWTFGAGAAPASCGPSVACQGATFTYMAPGAPVVTLNGYVAPVMMTGNVQPGPVTAGSNAPICQGSALNLTASTLAGSTFSWVGPNGFTSTQQNPSIPNALPTATGFYYVTRTLGGNVTTAFVSVVVKQGPGVFTVSSNSPVCAGGTISLSAPALGSSTYAWTGPNGFTSTLQSPSIGSANPALNAGTYAVVITNTATGCFSSASTTVVINSVPVAPGAGSNSPVCAGSPLTLTASTVAGATYAWTGPNGFTSTQQNPSIGSVTPAAAGTYSVKATVNGCTSPVGTTLVGVTVVTAPMTAPSTLCPNTVSSASVPDAGAGATYLWTAGNGTILGGQGTRTLSFRTGASGTTVLGVTVTVGSCSVSSTSNVSIVSCTPLQFYTLPPCRLLDTRNTPNGPLAGPALVAGARRDFLVTGVCGIPSTAVSLSVNVTVVNPALLGALSLFPGDGAVPLATTISFLGGKTRANNALVRLATDASGVFSVQSTSTGPVPLIVDVNGYFQ